MSNIDWTAEWSSINCYKNEIEPCNWQITASFNDESLSMDDQAIAFGRMRYLIKELYHGSIFIYNVNPLLQTFHKKLDTRLITLPFVPNNYAVAAITWYKLLSVTQGRISLEHLHISCDKADNLGINFDPEEAINDELMEEISYKDWDVPAWWFRPTPTTWDVLVKKDKKNVMEYDNNEWPEYLQWERKPDTVKSEKKKSESNVVPLKKNWKPEVIKGDKN